MQCYVSLRCRYARAYFDSQVISLLIPPLSPSTSFCCADCTGDVGALLGDPSPQAPSKDPLPPEALVEIPRFKYRSGPGEAEPCSICIEDLKARGSGGVGGEVDGDVDGERGGWRGIGRWVGVLCGWLVEVSFPVEIISGVRLK